MQSINNPLIVINKTGHDYTILPHGYVKTVRKGHMGSDEGIIEAARMSTGKGFLGWGPYHNKFCAVAKSRRTPKAENDNCGCETAKGDEGLLRTLVRKRHTTPFEQAVIAIEVQAPLFAFREWHRHRTQSYNEFSARYAQMPDIHWMPTVARIRRGIETAGNNKQAKGIVDGSLTHDSAFDNWLFQGDMLQQMVYKHYTEGLALGVPKEIARFNTPVARYSKMRACANVLNWMRFLGLRDADDAQEEIRLFAACVREILRFHYPRTVALFYEHKL